MSKRTNPGPSLQSLSNSLADAVEAAAPFVVGVRTGRRAATGVVVGDGEVVTAAHVLRHRGGGPVRLVLPDGTTTPAEVVGRDPSTDLALLRAEASLGDGVAAPAWASADDLRVGWIVLALGRPGASVRATHGIVGGVGDAWRTHGGGAIDAYVDVDGSLPGGFSGGPLVAADGSVVGINTSRLVRGGTTIPAATVTRVLDAIRERGDLRRGWLGVVIQPADVPEEARAAAGGAEQALLVTSVAPRSPAQEAGVRPGDLLLAIDGAATASFADLAAALSGRTGDQVPLDVLRQGARKTLTATVGERPRRKRAC